MSDMDMFEVKPEDEGKMPRIEAVWAFLAVDERTGDEGIIGMATRQGWIPFVAADEKRANQLRPVAREIATASNRKVRVAKFTVREDLETFEP